jgi:hypothetical protein
LGASAQAGIAAHDTVTAAANKVGNQFWRGIINNLPKSSN